MLSKNGNTAVRRERERDARGALQRPVTDPSQHEKFSPGARPDVAVKRGAPDGLHWLLFEVKVATPIATRGKTETTLPRDEARGISRDCVGELD